MRRFLFALGATSVLGQALPALADDTSELERTAPEPEVQAEGEGQARRKGKAKKKGKGKGRNKKSDSGARTQATAEATCCGTQYRISGRDVSCAPVSSLV